MGSSGIRLRTPEVARRLGTSGPEVYRLIFAGDLVGTPDEQGVVYIDESAVDAYLRARRAEQATQHSTD